MKAIQLSILIATLNSEKHISDLLESVKIYIASSPYTFEVVIKDGGSTDSTEAIVQEYQKSLSIQFLKGHDTGIYNAMNQEIEAASGEWLIFMGSDDVFLPGIVDLLDLAKTREFDLIYGDTHLKHENRVYDGEFSLEMLFKAPPSHQGTIFKAELFEKYGNYNEEYFICSDYDRFLLFFSRPEIGVKYVDTVVAIFNDDGFSRSGPKDLAFARDRYRLILQYFNSDEFDEDQKETLRKTKRHDAIMLIDYGKHLILAYTRYLSTIRPSEKLDMHLRYLFGSFKRIMLNRTLK